MVILQILCIPRGPITAPTPPRLKDTRQIAVVAALLAPKASGDPRVLSNEVGEHFEDAPTWVTIPEIVDEDLRRVAAAAVLTVARMAAPMAPQPENRAFTTGIGEPTQLGGVPWVGPPPLDVENQLELLRRAKDRFCEVARQRAHVCDHFLEGGQKCLATDHGRHACTNPNKSERRQQ